MPTDIRNDVPRPKRKTALVLQGGGALGTYQAGVYETLVARNHEPDWVVGTSIGAINGALIAGNPPERRVARLHAFWDAMARDEPFAAFASSPFAPWIAPWLMPWLQAGAVLDVLTRGIPGFFLPRQGALIDIRRTVPTADTGFYDTTPLRETLKDLVHFDYLATGPVRLTVCAVDVATGAQVTFDSRKDELGPEHIMASGALPPGFPPVEINGRAYWDGGIYSNTPVDIVMDDAERTDLLCFMVDLWDPSEAAPRSIGAAMARYKDILYASRTNEHLEDHRTIQNLRRAVKQLTQRLPPADRDDPAVRRLAHLGCSSTIDIVRLVLKAAPGDDYNKDIDFSRPRLEARWDQGRRDAERALRNPGWLAPPPADTGMVIHELKQEDDSAQKTAAGELRAA